MNGIERILRGYCRHRLHDSLWWGTMTVITTELCKQTKQMFVELSDSRQKTKQNRMTEKKITHTNFVLISCNIASKVICLLISIKVWWIHCGVLFLLCCCCSWNVTSILHIERFNFGSFQFIDMELKHSVCFFHFSSLEHFYRFIAWVNAIVDFSIVISLRTGGRSIDEFSWPFS